MLEPIKDNGMLLNVPETVDPLNDGISSVQLIRHSGSDVDVVNAARVSYGKFVAELTDRDAKLIEFLMKHHHTSPFEHNQLSFRVKCPTFVMRQWIRHRMNSYNEISYRYVKAPLEFYVPAQWRYQDMQNRQGSVGAFQDEELKKAYLNSLEVAKNTYEHLLEKGVAREIARGLLPVCTYTEFIFTCNLHSLMNFMKLRLEPGAQWEIRVFAQALLTLALPHFPVSLGSWKKLYMPDVELK
ncbi:FAD-dependent thymidylate synthase [soil metagenome]